MQEILIIEDEEAVRSNIAELLQSEGYFVREARNGEEGYKMALESIPDLVICDILMPGIDGYTVKKKFSANPETATTPFIFLTALTAKEDFRKGMDSGADDYITKPFTRDELLKALKTRLDKHKTLERIITEKKKRLNRDDHPLPIEMLTPISVILGYSEILSNLSDENFYDIDNTKSIANEIYKSALKVFDFMQHLLFKDELEMMMVSSEKIEDLRRESMQISSSMMREWLDTGIVPEGKIDFTVDFDLANLGIYNDHLFKVFEILIGYFLDEIGFIRQYVFAGKKKMDNSSYVIRIEFNYQSPFPGFTERLIQRWHSLPRERPLDFNGIKIFNINIIMELYNSRLSFSPIENGLMVELIIPLRD